ncbi:MAG: NAD/NADP octopine/nopaline dehydrogenase family protein [Oscillospiraceae bacterium]|nr:NAD/NADP octopine/nopaline dehydrogenase family protein [Oscillospiraceae bacterium]
MNIAIAGGGSIGTQFAVHCAEKKHNVIIYTSNPTAFSTKLCTVNENSKITHFGEIKSATNDAAEAFSRADWIFVTVPQYRLAEMASIIFPYVKPGLKICLVPGAGGGEHFFSKCAERGAVIYGLQRVPAEARVLDYGRSVMTGKYTDKLRVAAFDPENTDDCADIASYLLGVPYESVPNYLSLTLAPSNAVLNVSRLYTLLKDYEESKTYIKIPLFYGEWDNESSETALKCDEEIAEIRDALDMFDLSMAGSLKEFYDCETPEELTERIRGAELSKGIPAPMAATAMGCIPNFTARCFMNDFGFGLSVYVQTAELLGIDAVTMKTVMKWYRSLPDVSLREFNYRDHGINNIDDLIKFYSA